MAADTSPRTAALRTRYEKAYSRVLKNSKNLDYLTELENAATLYASTKEGRTRITQDAQNRDTAGDIELSTLLNKSAQRGKEKSTARVQATRRPSETPETQGPPEPLLWTPENPVWPKRTLIDETLTGTRLPATAKKQAWETYQILYRHAWRTMFPKNAAGEQLPFPSNQAGWEARAQAAHHVTAWMAGATLIAVKHLEPGMVICNGYGIRRVLGKEQKGKTELTREGEHNRRIELFTVRYEQGQPDRNLPADQTVVRLPHYEGN